MGKITGYLEYPRVDPGCEMHELRNPVLHQCLPAAQR